MPSLRQRLGRKRNKAPQKSKSLGDLDDAESENNFDMSKDYSSQISDIGNISNAEGVNSEETTSQVSSTTDSQSAKKKRFSFKKIRRSLSRKKKTSVPETRRSTSLIETGNGTVVLVQEVELKGDQEDDDSKHDEVKVRRTQSCTVHDFSTSGTPGKNNGATGKHLKDSKQEVNDSSDRHSDEETVDEWRMTGLLGTVEKSNSIHSGSSRSNLAISSVVDSSAEKKKDLSPASQNSTSTPKGKESVIPVFDFDLITTSEPHKEESEGIDTKANDSKSEEEETTKDVSEEAVQNDVYSDVKPTTLEGDGDDFTELYSKELMPLMCTPVDLEEEKFCETHGLDYEYSSQDSKVEAAADVSAETDVKPNNKKNKSETKPFATTEIQIQVQYPASTKDNKDVYDMGKGKKVVVRTLEDVLRSGGMEINEEILTNEWLVLNLAKDDWVIVDYNKANGEIIEIFDRSVEAI